MAKIRVNQDAMSTATEFLIKVEHDELLGPEEYWKLIVEASHQIVDELVQMFRPEVEDQFRQMIPELVKQMGNELIVKGLKQMAKEDK